MQGSAILGGGDYSTSGLFYQYHFDMKIERAVLSEAP